MNEIQYLEKVFNSMPEIDAFKYDLGVYEYRGADGVVYFGDNNGNKIQGITDTKGLYFYARYVGDQYTVEGRALTANMRLVLVLPNVSNAQAVTQGFLSKFASANISVGAVNGNRQEVYFNETGAVLKRDNIALVSIDFTYSFHPSYCFNIEICQ